MAQGFFAGGNGTKDSPFLIEDADDLNAIRMHCLTGRFFKLINDINLADGKYNIGQGWNPIPSFVGVFDGNNHKIMGLTIKRPTTNFVGFFRICSGIVKNLIFVDSNVNGHTCVGVLAGLYWNFYVSYDQLTSVYGYNKQHNIDSELAQYRSYLTDDSSHQAFLNNVHACNCKISAVNSAAGLLGGYRFFGETYYWNDIKKKNCLIKNCMVDVEIESQDGCATGIANCTAMQAQTLYNNLGINQNNNCNCNCGCQNQNCYRIYFENDRGIYCKYDNLNGARGYANPPTSSARDRGDYEIYVENCVVNLKRNDSITTYYGFINAPSQSWSQYNVVNSGEYKYYTANNIVAKIEDVEYSVNILSYIDRELFKLQPNHKIESLNLNNDSIYLQFNNGYHVYDFTNNEFVQKYTKFSNENSKEIIQNGMDKVSFSKIPNSKLKEIQDKYGKVKVVNCINAHKKIVYKTSVLEMNYDKQKSVYRKKVEFNKFNEVTSIKKK